MLWFNTIKNFILKLNYTQSLWNLIRTFLDA
jgi:hypothetical protein